MNKIILGLFAISSVVMAGCALETGGGEDSVSSLEQELKAVLFKGAPNTGYSNELDKIATIKADNLTHATAGGVLAISLSVDDTAPFEAGSVTQADCPKHTISVTYKQADIQQFTATSPAARIRSGRCIASVLLDWNKSNPAGTVRFLPPSTAASQQRVVLSAMPVSPAVGNITVVTKTNGAANNDKYSFRTDP